MEDEKLLPCVSCWINLVTSNSPGCLTQALWRKLLKIMGLLEIYLGGKCGRHSSIIVIFRSSFHLIKFF